MPAPHFYDQFVLCELIEIKIILFGTNALIKPGAEVSVVSRGGAQLWEAFDDWECVYR